MDTLRTTITQKLLGTKSNGVKELHAANFFRILPLTKKKIKDTL